MDDKTYKRGTRNAWILTLLLIVLVAVLTWFTMVTNQPEVPPHWVQGDKEFVPAASRYGQGYPLPAQRPAPAPQKGSQP